MKKLVVAILFASSLIILFSSEVVDKNVHTSVITPGLKDEDILFYLEAITRIQENSLFLPPSITRDNIIQGTLKAYLATKDQFSDYLTHDEYLRFRELQNDRYVGIGIEIEKDRDGEIVCFPYPGSPAEEAGVAVGDRLRSIDGVSISGRSLFTLGSLVQGKKGTKVILEVITEKGTKKQISVTRSAVRVQNASKHWYGTMPVIKLFAFTPNTKDELKHILSDWKKDNPVIIDLRGNPGGDLHAAIDSAMLFLEKTKKIVSIKTRAGIKVYESSNGVLSLLHPIYLWQDETTASAAEVFIGALTENDKAISIGKKTFGKGTKQDIIELSDGSALVLTTGYLQTPHNIEYQGRGLNPTYMLEGKHPEMLAYLGKVEELVGLSNKAFPAAILNQGKTTE